LPNFFIFNKVGLLNNYFSLILPYSAFSVPISLLILSGFLKNLPRAIEESAIIEGSGVIGVVFKLILPMSMPAIVSISILTFLSSWNEFIMANTFLYSDDYKTLPFSIIQFSGQYASNYSAQFAVMTLIAIPSILIYILFSEQMKQGITAGAVKG
jgi:raffinose/stachyose/melibiose transport system permease protein